MPLMAAESAQAVQSTGRPGIRRWIGAGALILAACTTVGLDPGAGVRLTVGDYRSAQGEPGARVVAADARRIIVEGAIQTGTPCYSVTAGRSDITDGVELRVTARPNLRAGQACAQVIALFPYTAEIDGLGSGPRRVRVVHAYEGTGWPPTAMILDTIVAVP
jgi:hypothetical protein